MVVNSLSKSSFKLLFLAPDLLTASGWRSLRVDGGRVYPSDPIVGCLRKNFIHVSLQSFTVFD